MFAFFQSHHLYYGGPEVQFAKPGGRGGLVKFKKKSTPPRGGGGRGRGWWLVKMCFLFFFGGGVINCMQTPLPPVF